MPAAKDVQMLRQLTLFPISFQVGAALAVAASLTAALSRSKGPAPTMLLDGMATCLLLAPIFLLPAYDFETPSQVGAVAIAQVPGAFGCAAATNHLFPQALKLLVSSQLANPSQENMRGARVALSLFAILSAMAAAVFANISF